MPDRILVRDDAAGRMCSRPRHLDLLPTAKVRSSGSTCSVTFACRRSRFLPCTRLTRVDRLGLREGASCESRRPWRARRRADSAITARRDEQHERRHGDAPDHPGPASLSCQPVGDDGRQHESEKQQDCRERRQLTCEIGATIAGEGRGDDLRIGAPIRRTSPGTTWPVEGSMLVADRPLHGS